jgi:hypothetical protein
MKKNRCHNLGCEQRPNVCTIKYSNTIAKHTILTNKVKNNWDGAFGIICQRDVTGSKSTTKALAICCSPD